MSDVLCRNNLESSGLPRLMLCGARSVSGSEEAGGQGQLWKESLPRKLSSSGWGSSDPRLTSHSVHRLRNHRVRPQHCYDFNPRKQPCDRAGTHPPQIQCLFLQKMHFSGGHGLKTRVSTQQWRPECCRRPRCPALKRGQSTLENDKQKPTHGLTSLRVTVLINASCNFLSTDRVPGSVLKGLRCKYLTLF